jgi:hypothetical protein
MAIRLELVTEQGVEMMRRNIKRGRRSEAFFLKQWSERIDAELASKRKARKITSNQENLRSHFIF